MMMSGSQADLEQGVGAAVDGDEHGLELPDVGAERFQVAAVVVTPHHDQGVAAAEVAVQRRQDEGLEGEPGLPADLLQRVDGERLELDADVGPGQDHPGGEVVGVLALAGGQELVAPPQVVADETQLLTLARRRSSSSEPTSSISGMPASAIRSGPMLG